MISTDDEKDSLPHFFFHTFRPLQGFMTMATCISNFSPPFRSTCLLAKKCKKYIFIEKNLEKILSKKDQQLCFAHVLNRWTTTRFLAQNGFWNPESQPETIQISFCHSRSPSHHLYLLFLLNVGVCLLLIAAIKIKMYYSLVVEVLNNHLAVCIVLMLGFYSLLNFSILF